MKTESAFNPYSGYVMLTISLTLLLSVPFWVFNHTLWMAFVSAPIGFIILAGFIIVNPNESTVLVLFGKYKGTVKQNGFFWVNPLFAKRKISLRARNLDSQPIKVNDKLGNPIMIGIVLVWKVAETFKAAFEVDHFESFVKIQSESAIRKLAGTYPYDNFDDEQIEVSLRSGANEVHEVLMQELSERLSIAGIEVMEARISNLSYAQEIAGAMLQRQQATAIVAARTKIVEGAVGMVDLALKKLSAERIIELDDDKKAAMVTNLMVVLCSDKAASPVINAGTLNH